MSKEQKTDTSQSGTITGYRVEAMYDSDEPREIDGRIFTREWKQVHFNESGHGVPIGHRHNSTWLAQGHCYSYQAAQALRWWFHANVEADQFFAGGLKTRLVSYRIAYSVTATRGNELGESEHKPKAAGVTP